VTIEARRFMYSRAIRKELWVKKTDAKSDAEAWTEDDQWSIDSDWSGTAMIYTASGEGSFAMSGDYRVTYEDESDPDNLRAARLFRASQGKAVAEVLRGKLADELVLIMGG
jgi:hypothetical protein